MSQSAIILPMAAMVLLTFALALNTLRRRSAAVKAGQIRFSRFRAMQGGGDIPEPVAVAERAFHNALEVPPLFYAGCIAALALGAVTPALLALAWAFVAARLVQAGIHLTYNNVMHRLYAFMAGWLALLALWGLLALRAVQGI